MGTSNGRDGVVGIHTECLIYSSEVDMKPAKYEISPEECDRIAIHTLKYYKDIVINYTGWRHEEDIKYDKELLNSINFLLKYMGEEMES